MSSNGILSARKNQSRNMTSLVARTLQISGEDVTIRLEPSYWDGLDEISRREDLTADELCTDVQERVKRQGRRPAGRTGDGSNGVSLANALRVFIVGYFRQAATERGHVRAGHGKGDPFLSTPFDSAVAGDA